MLGEAGTLNLYNSLDNGYSPQFTGEEAKADFREGNKTRILTSNASGNPKILAQDSAGSQEL